MTVAEYPGMRPRSIRVLELVTSTAGGAGWHVLRLALGMQQRGFDVSVAFGPGYPLDALFAQNGLRTHVLAMRRSLSPPRNILAGFQVLDLLRRQRIDILHTHCSMAGFVGRIAGRLARVPVILHTLHALASREHQAFWKRRLFLAVERGLNVCTDHYVAVSAAILRQAVASGIAETRHTTLIHHGLDLGNYRGSDDPSESRRELGFEPNGPVIGMVGRLEPQKGVEYLLAAMARVRESHPDARLLIVGDGPLRQHLETLATRLRVHDRVLFLGWSSEVPKALKALDVFCMPSLWESFGYAILEAMACGVPVVASDVEGIPEVVIHRETGLLVPPRDPSALAEALCELLEHPVLRQAMGRAGQERVERCFSEQVMLDHYEELFVQLHRRVRQGKTR